MKLTKIAHVVLLGAGLAAAAQLSVPAQAGPAASGAAVSVEPGKAHASATEHASATVVAVDTATRTVTLKKPDGATFDVVCGDDVKNFAQIKVGDTVHATYTRALSVELKKGGGKKDDVTVQQSATGAPAGSKPAGVVSGTVTAIGTVVAVDAAKHLVTVRGPRGNEVDLEVQDPAQLKNIAKGDQVEMTYTEAVAVKVEAAAKPKAK